MTPHQVINEIDQNLQRATSGNFSHKVGVARQSLNYLKELLEDDWETDISKAKQLEEYWFALNTGEVILGFIDVDEVFDNQSGHYLPVTAIIAFCEIQKPVYERIGH